MYLRLGESDCEALREGLLAQPVNALSALGFVAAGVWLLARGRNRSGPARRAAAVYGATLVLVGLGSFAYHGPQTGGSVWLHNWSVSVAAAFVVVTDVWKLGMWRRDLLMPAYLGVVVGLGLVLAAAPDAGAWVSVLVLACVGLSELAVYRREPPSANARRLLVVAAGAILAAATVQLLGRTGAPLCSPSSLAQGHAAWHLLGAVAAAAVAAALVERVAEGGDTTSAR